MENNELYNWKVAYCPTLNNEFNLLIRRMNKYGNLPWPYSRIAHLIREKIKQRLVNFEKIHFDFGFYCAFGNLYGKDVWFTNTYILDYAPVYFGEHITIGPDVKIITSWHDLENLNIVKAESITIEDNVWITMNAVILPGVTIGKNSVVAAGAIVTKSVPPNSLVAGNPARVIKTLARDYPFWEEYEHDCAQRSKNKPKSKASVVGKYLPKFIKRPLSKIYFLFK
jgi:acetyltransferase-like isoleucine patch superfamily enzyme